jgi:hypothetical protein
LIAGRRSAPNVDLIIVGNTRAKRLNLTLGAIKGKTRNTGLRRALESGILRKPENVPVPVMRPANLDRALCSRVPLGGPHRRGRGMPISDITAMRINGLIGAEIGNFDISSDLDDRASPDH